MHRIYGEYKINCLIDFWSKFKGIQCVVKAVIDVVIIELTVLGGAFKQTDFKVIIGSNTNMGGDQSQDAFYAIALIILFNNYNRDNNVLTIEREIGNASCFIISIMVLLGGDPYLDGFNMIFACPNYVFSLVFCFLWGGFKNFLFLNLRTVWPDTPCVLAMKFYTGLEDKIILEEYDMPETNHSRKKSDSGYKWLVDAMHQNNLLSINTNMLSVHRSDSMD